MKLQFSLRYFLIGFYVDRDGEWLRFYPFPFVRVSVSIAEAVK